MEDTTAVEMAVAEMAVAGMAEAVEETNR